MAINKQLFFEMLPIMIIGMGNYTVKEENEREYSHKLTDLPIIYYN